MDATAWITLAGLLVTISLAVLAGIVHGVILLTTVSNNIEHIRKMLDGVKETQDDHGDRLDNHEGRIIRLEGK
jgi:hypothetical protein